MFHFWPVFLQLISLKVQGHTVPHWKGLISGKNEVRGLWWGSTFNICQAFLKSVNLLHKRCLGNLLYNWIDTVCQWPKLSGSNSVGTKLKSYNVFHWYGLHMDRDLYYTYINPSNYSEQLSILHYQNQNFLVVARVKQVEDGDDAR